MTVLRVKFLRSKWNWMSWRTEELLDVVLAFPPISFSQNA